MLDVRAVDAGAGLLEQRQRFVVLDLDAGVLEEGDGGVVHRGAPFFVQAAARRR